MVVTQHSFVGSSSSQTLGGCFGSFQSNKSIQGRSRWINVDIDLCAGRAGRTRRPRRHLRHLLLLGSLRRLIHLSCVEEPSPAHVRRRRKERFHHVNKQAFVLFSPPDRQEEDGSRSSFFFVISSGKYTYLGSPGQRLGASQLFLISNVFSTSQLVRIILRPNLIRLNVNYPHKREPLSW